MFGDQGPGSPVGQPGVPGVPGVSDAGPSASVAEPTPAPTNPAAAFVGGGMSPLAAMAGQFGPHSPVAGGPDFGKLLEQLHHYKMMDNDVVGRYDNRSGLPSGVPGSTSPWDTGRFKPMIPSVMPKPVGPFGASAGRGLSFGASAFPQ